MLENFFKQPGTLKHVCSPLQGELNGKGTWDNMDSSLTHRRTNPSSNKALNTWRTIIRRRRWKVPWGQDVLLRDHAKQWMEDKRLIGLFNGGEGGEKKTCLRVRKWEWYRQIDRLTDWQTRQGNRMNKTESSGWPPCHHTRVETNAPSLAAAVVGDKLLPLSSWKVG